MFSGSVSCSLLHHWLTLRISVSQTRTVSPTLHPFSSQILLEYTGMILKLSYLGTCLCTFARRWLCLVFALLPRCIPADWPISLTFFHWLTHDHFKLIASLNCSTHMIIYIILPLSMGCSDRKAASDTTHHCMSLHVTARQEEVDIALLRVATSMLQALCPTGLSDQRAYLSMS